MMRRRWSLVRLLIDVRGQTCASSHTRLALALPMPGLRSSTLQSVAEARQAGVRARRSCWSVSSPDTTWDSSSALSERLERACSIVTIPPHLFRSFAALVQEPVQLRDAGDHSSNAPCLLYLG